MTISVACPSCSAKLRAPSHASGRTVKCPKCSGRIQIPTQEPAENGLSATQPPPPAKEAVQATPSRSGAIPEKIYLDDDGVTVTNFRLSADGKTYSMQGVTYVEFLFDGTKWYQLARRASYLSTLVLHYGDKSVPVLTRDSYYFMLRVTKAAANAIGQSTILSIGGENVFDSLVRPFGGMYIFVLGPCISLWFLLVFPARFLWVYKPMRFLIVPALVLPLLGRCLILVDKATHETAAQTVSTEKSGREEGAASEADMARAKQDRIKSGKEDGIVIVREKDGQLREAGSYQSGKKQGLWLERTELIPGAGQGFSYGRYRDSAREGVWVSELPNKSGILGVSWQNGKRNGLAACYLGQDESKTVAVIHSFRDGELDGISYILPNKNIDADCVERRIMAGAVPEKVYSFPIGHWFKFATGKVIEHKEGSPSDAELKNLLDAFEEMHKAQNALTPEAMKFAKDVANSRVD